MSNLLNCPFCGESQAIETHGTADLKWLFAECSTCGARSPAVRRQTGGEGSVEQWVAKARSDAFIEWNRRALTAAHAAASTDGAVHAVEPLPMASAPKDGRPILAWSTYNVYAFIVRFDRELEDFEDDNGFSVRNLIGWWPLPIRKENA